jgi:putative phosphoribosyl transferase
MGSISLVGLIRMQPDFPGFKTHLWYSNVILSTERAELQRRNALDRYKLPPLEGVVRGRHVILVDDGIATGSNLSASVDCLRRYGASKITLVAPVGSREAVNHLRTKADDIVVPYVPDDFHAVGNYYTRFPQVTDEQVLQYMFNR